MISQAPERISAALERRRAAAAAAWDLTDEFVVIGAGEPVHLPGRLDVTYPFMAHTEYFYLTDRDLPGGVLAFDPADGWVDFVAPITEADRLWSGAPAEDPEGPTTDALGTWLQARSGRRFAALGGAVAAVPGIEAEAEPELTERLRFALDAVRRPKDEIELERLREANRTSVAAFAAAVPMLRAGVTERQVQIELECAAFRAGAERMAYDTIVGSGPNSGVLHFMPSERALRERELVLIDAGGEYRCYASDVTRTYAVGDGSTPSRPSCTRWCAPPRWPASTCAHREWSGATST